MEGLRNHNFIIPRPKLIIKREMPENQGKSRESLTEHLLSGNSPVGKVFSGAQHKISAFVQIVFPSKKRRSSLSRKSGRHMGVERPYVFGHFEVKPLNRGCLATFSAPKRERFFFNHMPTICPGQTRGHMTYETERIGEIAMFPDALWGLYGVICARRKGRQKPRATIAR